MKIKILLSILTLSLLSLHIKAIDVKGLSKNDQILSFIENKGQVHDQNYNARPDVLYGVTTGNMAVHIKKTGVSYQLYRVDAWRDVEDVKTKQARKEIDKQTIYRVDLTWINANTNFTKTEDEPLPSYSNYYLENCPNGALNVRSYKGITLHNLYSGINLHYYEKNGNLKHDYIVAPNSNYKQIQLKVEGARITVNKDGTLLLTTPLGKIQEGYPLVYQNGKQLKAKWLIKNNVLSFDIEGYNPTQQLIIDPVTRLWGTYYGGTGTDFGNSCAADASGNVYLAGYTDCNSSTVIATTGGHQNTFGGGYDAYLTQFNSSGVRQWSTYYGDATNQYGNSCATDANGNVYLAGHTQQNGSPVIATVGGHQPAHGGGNVDAFLVKFDNAGVRQWGTYYGGLGNEVGNCCTTDASGNVYLVGYTNTSFPVNAIATPGAHQVSFGGGSGNDAFLVKFSAWGLRQWGTYYGGNGIEEGNSCTTDVSGNVYLSGRSEASTATVIATLGSHQPTNGGSNDAFLVKFNGAGVRQWGTYYGGPGNEYAYSCATDASGNVCLAGSTNTHHFFTNVIATTGAHQTTYNGGSNNEAFLVKFNGAGVRQWGTYYGGNGIEEGNSCTTDAIGNVYLAGRTDTNTGTIIATTGSHQNTYGGGTYDAFMVKFDGVGIRQWGTYYGGLGIDVGNSCVADANGNLYLAGYSDSNTGTGIATTGSHQDTHGGGISDAFLVKFKDCISLSPVASVNSTVCEGSTLNFTASITGTTSPTYNWNGPNSFTSSTQNPSITNASTVNIGIYTLTINNSSCIETQTISVNIVNTTPTISTVSNASVICVGQSATLTASGASTYTFNPGGVGSTVIVSPTVTLNYTITGTSAQGCNNSTIFTQSVSACTGLYSVTSVKANFMVYPNPTNGKIILETGSGNRNNFTIFNVLGSEILQGIVEEDKFEINLVDQPNGIYFLKVDRQTLKFIKE